MLTPAGTEPGPVVTEGRPGRAPPASTHAGHQGTTAGGKAPPRSLGEALRAAGMAPGGTRSGSETASEEDYDVNVRPALTNADAGVRRRHRRRHEAEAGTFTPRLEPGQEIIAVRDGAGLHLFPDDDKGLQDFLRRSSRRARESDPTRRPGKFTDLVFTRQFSAFDRHNVAAVNSPFHGFYILFWLAVALFVFKISANNWRTYGSILGSSDIINTMFHREVFMLLLSDGVMCGLTGVSWLLQKVVLHGYLSWDGSGWIIQHVWQTAFIVGVVALTHLRDWPWTHTVYFVLHGIVMLMKQHSYAFYNGYLSSVYQRRQFLLSKLKQLQLFDPASTPSQTDPPVSAISTQHLSAPPTAAQRRHSLSHLDGTEETDIDRIAHAIATRQPLDDEQIQLFERIVKWEIDALADELRGTATHSCDAYPNSLTFKNHYQWIPLPTLVYELEYPTSDTIDWSYVAEKLVAMVGVLFVMVQVSQYSIYPVVMKTVEMKENHVPLGVRFQEFPWLLGDLIFPFMMEYLLVWYLIWETILNVLAELTFFADRSFYDAWWNSVSWDQFARDWNRPVHNFLLRHVYHSSISSLKVKRHTATLITFFLSACIHELVMWCLFRKLRGYLLVLQMCQLPLVRLSRTRWLKGRSTLGNLIFWMGIFTGPSLLCSLYLIL